MRWRPSLLLSASLLLSGVGYAHHSPALFDTQRSVTLEGTVRSFQWTNPHSWIQVVVPGRKGDQEWGVEMGSPEQLFRSGWRPRSVKPGDKVVLVLHPERHGKPYGVFVSGKRADGTPFGGGAK